MHIAGRAYDTGDGGSKATSNGNERGSHFMLGSQRSHCHDKTNSDFVDSSEGVGRKGRMSLRLTGIEREYWMGTEIGTLRGYGSRGTVTAGGGSNQKGGTWEHGM